MSIEEELLELKNKIASDEKKQSEVEIKLSLKLESLKNDFDCDSLEEAKEYLKELQRTKNTLKENIDNMLSSLKRELGID